MTKRFRVADKIRPTRLTSVRTFAAWVTRDRFGLLAILLASAIFEAGCSWTRQFPVDDQLVFESQETKLPVNVAVVVSPQTRAVIYAGTETTGPVTWKGSIGEALPPNAQKAFAQVFRQSRLIQDRSEAADADVVIELSFGQNSYRDWSEGISICREFGVETVAAVFDQVGKPLFTSRALGVATTQRFNLTIKGKTEGHDFKMAVLSLNVPGMMWVATEELPKLHGQAVSGALYESLVELSHDVVRQLQSHPRQSAGTTQSP